MKSNKTGKQQETALEGNLDSVFLETGLSSALTSSSLLSTLEILTCSRNRATLFFSSNIAFNDVWESNPILEAASSSIKWKNPSRFR